VRVERRFAGSKEHLEELCDGRWGAACSGGYRFVLAAWGSHRADADESLRGHSDSGSGGGSRLHRAYPGITEAKTIHDWDPPFPTDLGKIRKRDEDYRENYRTTPKTFVSLDEGQALWGARFGKLTSLRIVAPADGDLEAPRVRFEQSLRRKPRPEAMGVMAPPVRQEGLSAAAGSTDFGEYFLYFSFFLVVSALLLVGLFFRLGVEERYREAGLLRAVGFSRKTNQVHVVVGRVGACGDPAVGAMAAVLYAGLVLYGLGTWWMDAVGTKLPRFHVSPEAPAGGALGGVLTALVVVWLTVRGLRPMGRPAGARPPGRLSDPESANPVAALHDQLAGFALHTRQVLLKNAAEARRTREAPPGDDLRDPAAPG